MTVRRFLRYACARSGLRLDFLFAAVTSDKTEAQTFLERTEQSFETHRSKRDKNVRVASPFKQADAQSPCKGKCDQMRTPTNLRRLSSLRCGFFRANALFYLKDLAVCGKQFFRNVRCGSQQYLNAVVKV